ncbi:hypothetical protein ACFV0O_28715 [Kitasatospora sp. NPDC059577]|uniref:hypothetical protein n=1 Tax=Kitasatospora sp. NPDC059577 TaxID=3346873 RepID=UPI003681C8C2
MSRNPKPHPTTASSDERDRDERPTAAHPEDRSLTGRVLGGLAAGTARAVTTWLLDHLGEQPH